jgi:two-component system chemotaxis response regulator CheY
MTYLVVDGRSEVRDALCYALLSFGIKGLPVAGRLQALEVLRGQSGVEGAIIDIDSREVEGQELIRQIRESEVSRGLKIIVHTIQSSKELVVRMMEEGVTGYLLKPFKQHQIYSKLKKVLDRTLSHDSQRRHIRVKPDPEELLRLSFRLPGHPGMISGRVVDISVGGVAVELFNPPPADALKPLTQIPSIQFTLLRKQFAPPGKVVLFKENLLALRFDFLTIAEKTSLARYVFKRIAS